MSKYAPAREDGLKPWVVTISEWGRKRDQVVYAATAADAKYKAIGRGGLGYSARVRRATPEDMP